jgi:tetratricopeptide (TPR) repeat protein
VRGDFERYAKELTLARHYLSIDRPAQALEVLDRLGGAILESAEAWRIRGEALLELDRTADGVAALQRGLALEPEDVPLLQLLSRAERDGGDLAAAERTILSALRLAPEEPSLLCDYAWLVALGGQFDKADRLVAEAARLDPDHPALTAARYRMAQLRGSAREQVAGARELLAHAPDASWAHAAHGVAKLAAGDARGGQESLGEAASLDPRIVERMRGTYEQAQLAAHWSMRPVAWVGRIGAAPVWAGAVGTIVVLNALGQRSLAGIFGAAYLVFCVYTWTAPAIARRAIRRRRR